MVHVDEGQHCDGGHLFHADDGRRRGRRERCVIESETDLRHGLEAVGGLFAQAAANHFGKGERRFGERPGFGVQNAGDGGERGPAGEGALAAEHLVEHQAKGEDVASGVHGHAGRLLGRHVSGGAQNDAELRGVDAAVGRRGDGGAADGSEIHQLGQAEIENLGLSVLGEHDVGGLQIAVDDAGPVRLAERRGNLLREPDGLQHREAAGRYSFGEGLALYILHGDEVVAALFRVVVDGDDVGVVEAGCRLRLADEAQAALLIGRHVRGEEFEREFPSEAGIERFVHGAHAAFA